MAESSAAPPAEPDPVRRSSPTRLGLPLPPARVRRSIPIWSGPTGHSWPNIMTRQAGSTRPWPARTSCRPIAGHTGPIAGPRRWSGRSMPIRARREWDEIEADVQMIQRLTPGNWVGEYLRNLVAEGRGGAPRPSARSKGLIVRGSEPEEAPAPIAPPRDPLRQATRDREPSTRSAAIPAPRLAPAPGPERPLSLPSPAKKADTFLALNVVPGSGVEIGLAPEGSKNTTAEAPTPVEGGSPKAGSRMRRRVPARARRTHRSRGRSSKRTTSGSSTATPRWPDAGGGRRIGPHGPGEALGQHGSPLELVSSMRLISVSDGAVLRAGDRATRGLAGDLDHVEQWGARSCHAG